MPSLFSAPPLPRRSDVCFSRDNPLTATLQGPLFARALAEIDRGIEAAAGRRSAHLRAAKALAVLWVALVTGGAVASADGPMGWVNRGRGRGRKEAPLLAL